VFLFPATFDVFFGVPNARKRFSCAVFHVCVSSGIMPPGGSSIITDYGRLCGNDLKAFCDKENVSLVICFEKKLNVL